MNTLKFKNSFLLLFFLGLSPYLFCQQIDFSYFKKNIAIVNVNNYKVLNSEVTNNSVFTVTLKDYSGKNSLPKGFGLNGIVFSDTGKNNDKKAGDGIYTSHDLFPAKNLNNFSNQGFADETFQHSAQVDEGGIKFTIKCKIVKDGCCPCPGEDKTCPACYWWGWSCWSITECEFGITADQ